MRDDDRLVALKTRPDDPRQRRVDEPEPHPLARLYGYVFCHSSVERHRVADAARHAGFHAVAETARDPASVVEPPILDQPQQVSIDGDRLGFLDDQRTGQTAPKLLQRVDVRVIPERPGIGRREFINKALTGLRLVAPSHNGAGYA